jgi:hypothetical protein
VAALPSPLEEPIMVVTPGDSSPAPKLTNVAAKPSGKDSGFEMRDLIPFALVGQIILIGLAGFVYFRRSQ